MPSRCASAVISSLSMPTSGRRTGSVTTSLIERHVLERLRRDLADDVAGDERLRPVRPRDAPRRCASSAGGRSRRAAAARTARTTCCWISPNGTRSRRERNWKLRQQRRQLARLLLRRARQDRIAVEVDEERRGSRAASSATRRPANRCRPTAGTPRARSTPVGSPPAPALLAEEVERLVGQRLDVDGQLRDCRDRRASRALP